MIRFFLFHIHRIPIRILLFLFFGVSTANLLAEWGAASVLAALIGQRFYVLKPIGERIALQDWLVLKWDMPGICNFLLDCETSTGAAVINYWYRTGDFKAGAVMGVLTSAPPFAENRQDAVINLLKLLAFANPPFILSRIENGKPPEGIFLLKNCLVPPVKGQLASLDHDKIALLLNIMHIKDAEGTNAAMAEYPPPIVKIAKTMIMKRVEDEDTYKTATHIKKPPEDKLAKGKVDVLNSTSNMIGNIADIFKIVARRMDPALLEDTSGDEEEGEGGGDSSNGGTSDNAG